MKNQSDNQKKDVGLVARKKFILRNYQLTASVSIFLIVILQIISPGFARYFGDACIAIVLAVLLPKFLKRLFSKKSVAKDFSINERGKG